MLVQAPPVLLEAQFGHGTWVSNMRSPGDANMLMQQSSGVLLQNTTPPFHSPTQIISSQNDNLTQCRTEHYNEPQYESRVMLPLRARLHIHEGLNDEGFLVGSQTNTPFDCLHPTYDLRSEEPVMDTQPSGESTQGPEATMSSMIIGSKANKQKADSHEKQKTRRGHGRGACLRCRIYQEPVTPNI